MILMIFKILGDFFFFVEVTNEKIFTKKRTSGQSEYRHCKNVRNNMFITFIIFTTCFMKVFTGVIWTWEYLNTERNTNTHTHRHIAIAVCYRLRDSGSGLVLSTATLRPSFRARSHADTQLCHEPSVSWYKDQTWESEKAWRKGATDMWGVKTRITIITLVMLAVNSTIQ